MFVRWLRLRRDGGATQISPPQSSQNFARWVWQAVREGRSRYNPRELRNPAWSCRSDNCKEWDNQGASQIDNGRLGAGMAVSTDVGIPSGFVVMEQTSKHSEHQNRNSGQRLEC
jgi:hypothetical protein